MSSTFRRLILLVSLSLAPLITSGFDVGWETDCSSLDGWSDNSDDPGYGARAEMLERSVVTITQDGKENWGKAALSIKSIDLDKTPYLIVQVNQVDLNSAFKVGVANEDWSDFHVVIPSTSAHGTHSADIKAATGWSGEKNFRLIFIVEGVGKSLYIDHVKIASEPPQGAN